MSALFVDTSGWGNLVDRAQPYHTLASNLYRLARQRKRPIFTSNYILTELVALLTSPLKTPRSNIVDFIDSLKCSPFVEIVHVDQSIDTAAWQLLSDRLDKGWSLVDCSSFVLMEELKIADALTNDKHFEQAGFVRLLK
jgi:predicted nucleic acid-binding protein